MREPITPPVRFFKMNVRTIAYAPPDTRIVLPRSNMQAITTPVGPTTDEMNGKAKQPML